MRDLAAIYFKEQHMAITNPCEPARPIPLAVRLLEDRVEALACALDGLHGRLTDVLQPRLTSDGLEKGQQVSKVPTSDLAQALDRQVERLQGLIDRVDDLGIRLEL